MSTLSRITKRTIPVFDKDNLLGIGTRRSSVVNGEGRDERWFSRNILQTLVTRRGSKPKSSTHRRTLTAVLYDLTLLYVRHEEANTRDLQGHSDPYREHSILGKLFYTFYLEELSDTKII